MAQEQVGDGFALHRAFKGAHLVDRSFPGVGNNSTDSGRGLSGHPEPGTELALPTPSWGWGSQRVRHNGSDLAGVHMEISARDLWSQCRGFLGRGASQCVLLGRGVGWGGRSRGMNQTHASLTLNSSLHSS